MNRFFNTSSSHVLGRLILSLAIFGGALVMHQRVSAEIRYPDPGPPPGDGGGGGSEYCILQDSYCQGNNCGPVWPDRPQAAWGYQMWYCWDGSQYYPKEVHGGCCADA